MKAQTSPKPGQINPHRVHSPSQAPTRAPAALSPPRQTSWRRPRPGLSRSLLAKRKPGTGSTRPPACDPGSNVDPGAFIVTGGVSGVNRLASGEIEPGTGSLSRSRPPGCPGDGLPTRPRTAISCRALVVGVKRLRTRLPRFLRFFALPGRNQKPGARAQQLRPPAQCTRQALSQQPPGALILTGTIPGVKRLRARWPRHLRPADHPGGRAGGAGKSKINAEWLKMWK
jgi:hypothetical protein